MAEELTPEGRADEASLAYLEKFGDFPPTPIGVDWGFYAEVLWKHIAKGERLAEDFDFYPSLPAGALA